MITLIQTINSIMIVKTFMILHISHLTRLTTFLNRTRTITFVYFTLTLELGSLTLNVDCLIILLSRQNFSFKALCLTETCCEQKKESSNSFYKLPNYTYIHQIQKDPKRGSVRICARSSLIVTKKKNLSMNCDDLETLVIEIDNAQEKSVIVNLVYRPPK